MSHIIAHRGASHDAPENTLPAFQVAWEQGADGIEGDFMLSGDGHVVDRRRPGC
jgi:glycerophosphoryl diester phosphodiesterase